MSICYNNAMNIKNMKIILASKSPRRKDILKNEGYDFSVIGSDYELDINKQKYSDQLLLDCVAKKYDSIKDKLPKNENLLVIAADTVVVLDNIIIGKPKDENEAFEILSNLSDKTHFVATGIQIVYIDKESAPIVKNGVEKTYVTFKKLTPNDINNYIKKSKPFDKAGAYGIQDDGFDFLESASGNIDNVIGFPMTLFNSLISS